MTGPPPHYRDGCWPDDLEHLLLTAILAPRERAAAAYRRWAERIDVLDANQGSVRLLSTLHHRLADLQVPARQAGLIRGMYRRTWYHNQLRLKQTIAVTEALRAAGIESMVLKGMALTLTHYPIGSRPMADVDIMVRPEQAESAMKALREAGLRSSKSDPHRQIAYRHALVFRDHEQREIDLHWYLIHESPLRGIDEQLWERARTVERMGTTLRTPSSTHHLLQSLTHGIRWHEVRAIRWIVDAATVLSRPEDPIDWDLLVAEARERQVTRVAFAGLDYLRQAFELPVSDAALSTLEQIPTGWRERLGYRLRTQPESERVFGHFPLTLLQYARVSRDQSRLEAVLGLPGYLAAWWNLADARSVPATVARKAIVWARGRLARRAI